ncbi:hypothetical protein V6N13_080401 [Hibiscus sabdariffa]
MGCSEFQPDVSAMNIWLCCLCNLKEVKLGFSVFAMIIKLGLQPDPYTMNALLLGLSDEGRSVEAMGLFWKLLTNGYPYDQCTYGIIIKGLCRSGNTRFALVLLIKMNGNGSFEPDVIYYNTIIDGFCKEKQMGFCNVGRWDEAKRLLAAMVNKGISPDMYVLNALITPLCKDGKIQEAISLFNLMTQKGIKPDVATYNILIRALCKFGEWSLAKKFFTDMIGYEISPDVITFNSMIDVLCQEAKLSKAIAILELMARSGQCEEATSLLGKMVTGNIVPDIETFNILLDAISKKGTNDKAHEVLKIMDQHGVKHNAFTCMTMIRMYCALGEMKKAKYVFDSMATEGFAPDLTAYKMLINGYAKCKSREEIVRLGEEMLQKGLTLDVETHGMLRGLTRL